MSLFRTHLTAVLVNVQMDRSEEEIAEITTWRRDHHLVADGVAWKGSVGLQRAEPHNIHFFNYDPTLGPTDLSNVSVKKDANRDAAVFSIPESFTESARSRFVSTDNRSLGLSVCAHLNPHNAPVFPSKKVK